MIAKEELARTLTFAWVSKEWVRWWSQKERPPGSQLTIPLETSKIYTPQALRSKVLLYGKKEGYLDRPAPLKYHPKKEVRVSTVGTTTTTVITPRIASTSRTTLKGWLNEGTSKRFVELPPQEEREEERKPEVMNLDPTVRPKLCMWWLEVPQ